MSLTSKRGATLLEVLIAVVMVTILVASITVFFPKASSSIANSRRQMFANSFAVSRLNELKAENYAYIFPTAQSDFPDPADDDCDCSAVIGGADVMTLLPGVDATLRDGGILYTRKVCVNLVERNGANWDTFCPDNTSNTDKGLKNLRVQVSWTSGGNQYYVRTESMISR